MVIGNIEYFGNILNIMYIYIYINIWLLVLVFYIK